jgi:hypothetical protein
VTYSIPGSLQAADGSPRVQHQHIDIHILLHNPEPVFFLVGALCAPEVKEKKGKKKKKMRVGTQLHGMRRFLLANGASMNLARTVDAAALDSMERTYMREVRRHVPGARLIGVPSDLPSSEWAEYTRRYCACLVAGGALAAPCTVFVSLPGTPELEVCLLRLDRAGRVRLLR